MPSKVVNKLNVPPPVVRRKDPRQGGMALNFGGPTVETKSCTKCKQILPLIAYYLDRGKRKSSCKVCCNAQVKEIAERKKALKAGRSVPLAIEVDVYDRTGSQTIPVYTTTLEETNKMWAHVISYLDNNVPIPTTPGITVFQALRALFIREDAALKDVQEAQEGLAAAEKMLAEIRAEMSSFIGPRGALPSP